MLGRTRPKEGVRSFFLLMYTIMAHREPRSRSYHTCYPLFIMLCAWLNSLNTEGSTFSGRPFLAPVLAAPGCLAKINTVTAEVQYVHNVRSYFVLGFPFLVVFFVFPRMHAEIDRRWMSCRCDVPNSCRNHPPKSIVPGWSWPFDRRSGQPIIMSL